MAKGPKTIQTTLVGQAHHPLIEEARAKHKEFLRDTEKMRKESFRHTGDQMWPLIAAEMESQRLSKRTVLDTPGKQVLFKLSHPDFDWDAIDAGIEREAYGVTLTDEELQSHIERAQGQADALSGLAGSGKAASYKGVSQDAIDFNDSLDSRRRYLVWAAYQRADFDETAKIDGNKITTVYKRWLTEKMFYVCEMIERLEKYLKEQPKTVIDLLRLRYQADRLPLTRLEWQGRDPNVVLAVAIITASFVKKGSAEFRANPKFALKLVKAYDRYVAASNTIKRKDPNAMNVKHLKLKEFI